MIENFESVKKQLAELSAVINKFDSEAVQLRIVELIFQSAGEPVSAEAAAPKSAPRKPRKKRNRSSTSTDKNGAAAKPKSGSTGGKRGEGPMAIVRGLVAEGYFSERRQIADIRKRIKNKRAKSYKTRELSPTMSRLLRDGTLDREKNADNLYEYFQK